MEVQFTPEQEAQLAQIANFEGIDPERLVQDAALRLIEHEAHPRRICPECGHRFAGRGWDGIEAHWRSKHADVMPYEEAWQLIKAGSYDEDHVGDLEDIRVAEQRLNDLRAGRSTTHTLEEVERELGLAG